MCRRITNTPQTHTHSIHTHTHTHTSKKEKGGGKEKSDLEVCSMETSIERGVGTLVGAEVERKELEAALLPAQPCLTPACVSVYLRNVHLKARSPHTRHQLFKRHKVFKRHLAPWEARRLGAALSVQGHTRHMLYKSQPVTSVFKKQSATWEARRFAREA